MDILLLLLLLLLHYDDHCMLMGVKLLHGCRLIGLQVGAS
jgi:hypothetical protein